MSRSLYKKLIILLLLPVCTVSLAGKTDNRMKVDNKHVNSWNQFADQVLALHESQVKGKAIVETEKKGGYADNPDFYREVTYKDKLTDKVLSVIQWEIKNPEIVHSIEVNVYDDKGRIIRDYSAAYLPGSRNAPIQTLINLHNYNDKLHAYRQFDVSKDVIYEYCNGEFEGQEHELRLFEEDLTASDYDSRQLLKSPIYKACFKGLQTQVGKFIRPQ